MSERDQIYELHGFDLSYFTAKARVALRAKRVHLEEKRAHVPTILERTGLAFIPIVVTPDGETWQDTSDILDRLEACHPLPALQPSTPLHRVICALFELYADEFALTVAMHTRWGTPESEAMTRLRFGAMLGSLELGNRAADQMVKARFAVGATPEAGPAIEAHLQAFLDAANAHFEAHDYLLGERISWADCALMGPVYAHYYTDLVSRRLLLETAIPVVRWIEFCNQPRAGGGVRGGEQGDWFADDAIPETLFALLRVMGEDAVPMLRAMLETVESWADDHAELGKTPPRAVGEARAPLQGGELVRRVQAYSLYMVQRVLDVYTSLSDVERADVDRALEGTGWAPLLAERPRHRLVKKGYDLVFASPLEA
jgi:glutathione S-transferase